MLRRHFQSLCMLFAVVLFGMATATPAQAQSQLVTSAIPNRSANELVIRGGTFASGVRVFLAFVELTVTSVTPTEIHASLNNFEAGSHWLIVYQPPSGLTQFWATIEDNAAPTQALNGSGRHFTGDGWVLESVTPAAISLRATAAGGPRTFSFISTSACTESFGQMITTFGTANAVDDQQFGSMCNVGASLFATVWEQPTGKLTQFRCVRTSLTSNVCQRMP